MSATCSSWLHLTVACCAGNSNDGLKVATAVLAVVSFVSIMAIVVYYFRFYNRANANRANATIPPQHEAKSTPSAPPDSNVIQGKLRRVSM